MKKKIGPLEAWQWGAVVLSLVLGYYLYQKYQANAAANAAVNAANAAQPAPTTGTPGSDSSAGPGSASGTDPNLIDPTTGQPLLGEINQDITGLAAGIQGLTAQEATDATAIENALGSLPSQLAPAAAAAISPGVTNVNITVPRTPANPGNHVKKTMGHKSAALTAAEKVAAAATRQAQAVGEAVTAAGTSISVGSKKNPGHIVTHTPHGASAASAHAASAFSVAKAIAPPSHQKAPAPPTSFTPLPGFIAKAASGVIGPYGDGTPTLAGTAPDVPNPANPAQRETYSYPVAQTHPIVQPAAKKVAPKPVPISAKTRSKFE